MPSFRLQFPCGEIKALSARFDFGGDKEIGQAIASAAVELGYIPADTFVRLVDWKTSGQSVPRVLRNSVASIERATKAALDQATPERERAGALVALEGVGYPVASTVFHFGCADPTPSWTSAHLRRSAIAASALPTPLVFGGTT